MNWLLRLLGLSAILIGGAMILWIGYNFFIERQPETEGKNPILGILVALGLIRVGMVWIRGRTLTGR